MRQKRISESGSQQLLLDAYTIKTLLLQLHSLDTNATTGNKGVTGGSGGGAVGGGDGNGGGVGGSKGVVIVVPPMYTKLVTTKVCHITSHHVFVISYRI